MPRLHAAESPATPLPLVQPDSARVYAIETFLKVQALMRKLNLTPADCLNLLAEILEDLDRQIEDYEAEGDGLPFPPM